MPRGLFMKSFATLSLLALLLTVSSSVAQRYTEVNIPTRVTDAAKKYLKADVYANDSTTPKPVILIQTPYNKLLYRLSLDNNGNNSGASVPYDSAKYNYVIVDWRGFYANKDAAMTQYNRGLDGYDIVEWIATQKWCNGKIGTWGGSALGMIQFQTAAQKPPHLVCAAPFIKDFQTKYTDYYYGGDFRKEHVESLEKLGFITTNAILALPIYNTTWRAVEEQSDMADQIRVPMFVCSGWFDHYPNDVLRAFNDLRTKSDLAVRNKHKLLFGPWEHSNIGRSKQGVLEFPEAESIPVQWGMEFFNYYLRDEENAWEAKPTVRYFQMGENQWHTTDSWQSVGTKKVALYLREQQRLSLNPPPITGVAIPPDSLYTDPKKPVPTIGGSRFSPFDRSVLTGPQEVQSLRERSDVLAYATEELSADVAMKGAVELKVYFSCNRRDADISVRLCDVYPDGRWIILGQGIQRLRFRNSLTSPQLLKPDNYDSARVTLQDIAMTFSKGHRIGILLSGSNYPMFELNLHNGGDMYKAGDTLSAITSILHDYASPSALYFETDATTSVPEEETKGATEGLLTGLTVSPQPCTVSGRVSFMLSAPAHLSIGVYDMLGRTIQTLFRGRAEQGRQDYTIDTGSIEPGVYLLKVESSTERVSHPLLIMR